MRRGETEFFDVEDESGNLRQYQLDLVRIHRKRTGDAQAARRARAAEAPGGRRALRVLSPEGPSHRYDGDTGLLERAGDGA